MPRSIVFPIRSMRGDDGDDEIKAIVGLVAATALLTIAFLVVTYTSTEPTPAPQPSVISRSVR